MRGNGQNDPRSLIYWKLQNFSEEEAILKAKEKCRESSPRCKEFWIKKGFSEEEAKFKVGDFQNRGSANTGSKRTEEQKLKMRETQMKIKTIEYWTDKYGEELGIKNTINGNWGKLKTENDVFRREKRKIQTLLLKIL